MPDLWFGEVWEGSIGGIALGIGGDAGGRRLWCLWWRGGSEEEEHPKGNLLPTKTAARPACRPVDRAWGRVARRRGRSDRAIDRPLLLCLVLPLFFVQLFVYAQKMTCTYR